MDETALQQWSDALMEMRQARMDAFQKELEQKGNSFTPPDFFNQALTSLDQIVEKWVTQEQVSWDANLPDDPATAIKNVRIEAESVIDFEVESLQRDLDSLKTDAHWTDDAISAAEVSFQTAVSEIRNKYQLKLNNFNGAMRKKAPPPPPIVSAGLPSQVRYTSGPTGSGAGSVMMFILGLILGVAPSIYFWDSAKKADKRIQVEKSKLETDRALMEDDFAMLKEVLSQLASGKMRNLEGIDDEIRQIKSTSSSRKRRLQEDYTQERERLLKKLPAGDRLDRALEDLEYQRVQKDGDLREKERSDLERLEKQKKLMTDLMAR